MSDAKYLTWAEAGGPNECAHGYARGLPCPRCDARTAAEVAAAAVAAERGRIVALLETRRTIHLCAWGATGRTEEGYVVYALGAALDAIRAGTTPQPDAPALSPPDPRDAEIATLQRERDDARGTVQRVRAYLRDTPDHAEECPRNEHREGYCGVRVDGAWHCEHGLTEVACNAVPCECSRGELLKIVGDDHE